MSNSDNIKILLKNSISVKEEILQDETISHIILEIFEENFK